jgi:hypothetical protein
MSALRIVSFIASICLLFVQQSCSKEKNYPVGATREHVYEVMGEPSNRDDQHVAFWSTKKGVKSNTWREISSSGGYVAVFDESGKTLLPKISISATSIYPTMTDAEIVQDVSQRGVH